MNDAVDSAALAHEKIGATREAIRILVALGAYRLAAQKVGEVAPTSTKPFVTALVKCLEAHPAYLTPGDASASEKVRRGDALLSTEACHLQAIKSGTAKKSILERRSPSWRVALSRASGEASLLRFSSAACGGGERGVEGVCVCEG